MTLKDILISGKITISGGGGGISADDIADKTISGPLVLNTTEIKAYAFYDCDLITTVEGPNLTKIGENAFGYCTGLTVVNLPEVTTLNQQAFQRVGSQENPTTIVLPKLSTLSGRGHFDRGNFEAIDLGPNLASLPGDCIYHNTEKNICPILVLRRTDGVVAAATEAAINGAGGTVYVPSSLVESYKTASNWSTRFAAGKVTFAAIEGSYYATHYADGTPIA